MQTVVSDKQLHLNMGNMPPYTPSFQPNTPEQEPQYPSATPNGQGQVNGSAAIHDNQHKPSPSGKVHSARGTINPDGEGELDLNQPVSTLLRLGTQRAHVKAEHSAGAAALVQGHLGLEEYVRWLAVLWRIYDALELALAEFATHPVLAPTYDPALLARAPALAEDISYLLTLLPAPSSSSSAGTSSSLKATSLPPFALPPFLEEIFSAPPAGLDNYLSHIRSLASQPSTAPRLLAHAYVRYLGDLSGGQFIGARVKKSYNLQGEQGTKFYYFEFHKGMTAGAGAGPGFGDDESRADAKKRLNEVKDWYRRGMDEGVGEDDLLKADLVEEANMAFALNTDLFSVIRLSSSTSATRGNSASTKTDVKAQPATDIPASLTDKLSSFAWFGAAAGVGVLLNIYVQPLVTQWMSEKFTQGA
ncbi:hypothetical protein IAU60_005975 [Kwoniella sp. DSM 27419]